MAYRKTEFVENKRRRIRDSIVSVAKELVETGGWGNCTLARVAAQAGIANGSVYTHFARISDLYIEVFFAIAEGEVAIIEEIAGSDAPPVERLQLAIDTFAKRALKGRVKAYAVIAEPVEPQVDAVRQGFHARFIDQYERIVRDGMETGAFCAQDPRTSANCIVGAMIESLVVPLAPEASALADGGARLRRDILAFCMRAVGYSGGPAALTVVSEERKE